MSDYNTGDSYRGPAIPPRLGDQLQLALGLDERPATFGDWLDALAFLVDRDDIDVGLEMLCTAEDSRHRATFDGTTQHYQCVLDAIIVPFLADDVATVAIETTSPVGETTMQLTVTEDRIEADPAGTVMSFGVAADIDGPAEDVPSPMLAYGRFCPYGNAFPTEAEYEAWAAETDAITMAISMEDTLELAQAAGKIS